MRKVLSLLLMLVSAIAWADTSTWTHAWNKSRSDGGDGFYHMTNNDETTQTTLLNKLEWTYSGNTSVTAYTASAGQYFGSAKSPVTHATLTTNKLQGKILKVTLECKTKDAAQDVKIGVSVNGTNYGEASQLTTDKAFYDFTPAGNAEEGEIVITMDQASETKGIIYFFSMSIEYDGAGIVKPEPKDPELSYGVEEVTVECGDNLTANYLTNPYKVEPITYTCSDTELAVLDSKGNIWTTGKKTGSAIVTASFAGNDDYKAAEASYTLIVKEKPVIPAPTVTPAGGTFTEPVTVTITSDDPLCKTIWYSTTLTDVADMGYDEETIIVPGNTATVTIDETCQLLCVAVGDNNIGLPALCDFTMNIPLKANFAAKESSQTYYHMGWDGMEEASTWKYYGINERTWTLTDGAVSAGDGKLPAYSTINPESQYSLTIYYANDKQRERAVSPEIEVQANSKAEFYLGFSGVWLVYANLTLKVNDVTDGTSETLFDAFKWAQDNEFTGPSWEKFTVDLAKYAGHSCTFEFIYEGTYGDNLAIDDFTLKAEDTSDEAKITIMQGESVHFQDLSLGHPTAWAWTITDGNNTMTSSEQNPVITFEKAGTYDVTLKVSKDSESDQMTKTAYVSVKVESPKAHIGIPEGAYLSPYAFAYVPTNVPLTFQDKSTGAPTQWKWTFEGTDIQESSQQNPTVQYTQEGMYGMELTVANEAGSDRDFLVNAIQAGGTQEVWNISSDEFGMIGGVQLGWYGSYAGSNWLGMAAFAEKFNKPLKKAKLDGVSVYFDNVTSEDPDAEITISICLPDADGMPGTELATASLRAADLQYSATEIVPTYFYFDQPVEVEGEFFVLAKGFPTEGYSDNVNILCAMRPAGGKSTVYHLLEDEDESYRPLGTYTWYKNVDEAVSMCVAPIMTYDSPNTIPAGNYTITGDVMAKEGVTVPEEFLEFVRSGYQSTAVLEGDADELTVKENGVNAVLSAYTIMGDAISYTPAQSFTLKGRSFSICGAEGETHGRLKITATEQDHVYRLQDCGIIYRDNLVGYLRNVTLTLTATGIQAIQSEAASGIRKVVRGGKVIILDGDHQFNTSGMRLR